ncbi:M48 family metalloprotease [Paraburkholderia terrae]|uniref:hypothetical protein n=1 Tax=Paraburkholderia terrae TaxID=311230 RepID=UPI00296AD12B|nr:hypothetical protein [Paraburkholderia terrae]MDW3660292.1 hypothetical protein [Paraburkholderia terrae]
MKRFVARCTPWGTIQTGAYFRHLTPDEKSAVLLHERAHIAHRDVLRRVWWIVSLKILRDPQWVYERCRDQEFAADRYVKMAGYANGMCSFLRRHPQPASLLHPSSKQRLEALNV